MPTELNAGALLTFDNIDAEGDFSMAKEIEIALTALIGPLPSAPQKLVDDRRALFIAIANGVINHLRNKQAAVEVSFDFGFGQVIATTEIKVNT